MDRQLSPVEEAKQLLQRSTSCASAWWEAVRSTDDGRHRITCPTPIAAGYDTAEVALVGRWGDALLLAEVPRLLRTLIAQVEELERQKALNPAWRRVSATGCEDCGLPYEEFPLDTVLPDAEWLRVHPAGENGVLCARCIAKRAGALPDVVVVHARLVTRDDHPHLAALKNVPLADLVARLP